MVNEYGSIKYINSSEGTTSVCSSDLSERGRLYKWGYFGQYLTYSLQIKFIHFVKCRWRLLE